MAKQVHSGPFIHLSFLLLLPVDDRVEAEAGWQQDLGQPAGCQQQQQQLGPGQADSKAGWKVE
jgi:hypothetical protein